MIISYEIILTIVNLTNNSKETFHKDFEYELPQNLSDEQLYNAHHIISNNVQMFTLFKTEINNYCKEHSISINNIDIDEFNINSKTDIADVYFESEDESTISLEPTLKCYVHPKFKKLDMPKLIGEAYDDTTIIWSWDDDGLAHYLLSMPVELSDKTDEDIAKDEYIIAQLPIGTNIYTELNLEPDTAYTRRLVSYDADRTSEFSLPVTIQTSKSPIDISVESYEIPKNYDFTADDSEREIIDEKLEAFHSGVGDFNDLKVYKQMDSDFYQKFKAYIQLRGERTQLEKRYDTVGFNYKVCLETTETVEEQKGEVTFDIEAYPIERLSIKDYMYATRPVTICARMWCDVLLKKPNQNTEPVECPLKEPEWEKKTIKIPNIWVKDPVVVEPGNLCIVLSFDISGSMNFSISGSSEDRRYYIVRDAAVELINKIENFQKNGTPLKGKVRYAITMWAKEARTVVYDSADQAIQCIRSVSWAAANHFDQAGHVDMWGWQPTNLTNHEAGLTDWIGQTGDDVVIELFYTDGFANCTKQMGKWTWCNDPAVGAKYGGTFTNDDINEVYASISRAYQDVKNHGASVFTLFGADYNIDYDNALDRNYPNRPKLHWNNIKAYDQEIYNRHNSMANGISKLSYSNYSKNKILDIIWGGMQNLIDKAELEAKQGDSNSGHWEDEFGNPQDGPYREEPGGWAYKGWKDTGTSITLESDWNIDQCKWAHVVIPPMNEDPWTITINDTITPVVYARNEQRAIIPYDSIIYDKNFDDDVDLDIMQEAIQVDSRSVQKLILDAVKNTEEWAAGYNHIVEAFTDEEKKQGQYIIRGLFIKDKYAYADEDTIPDVNFNDDDLVDGYTGSINVYAEISKLNTSSYGDDIYAVAPDKYVWLSGYTDAIIYDGERIESFELNASGAEPTDKQTEILVSPNGSYKHLLWNRKNNTIKYKGANNKINHCIDLIIKDDDVYITGTEKLKDAGTWVLFMHQGTDISDLTKIVRGVTYPMVEILENDVVAHNDESYLSPILNYRFNYEDPDAYTSYYELLPTCKPMSVYKHIVLVHIYYARNIYIQDEEHLSGSSSVYIESFGDDNIATKASPYYLNNKKIKGQTYFRDDYIDDFIWFKAKPMMETRPYYDEKPNPGMDTFYGKVNGRYKNNNKSGQENLRVATPMFNIPTTIDGANIKIYIIVSEFYPSNALVSYKWDHPSAEKDSITNKNGDFVEFSSDTLVYKDIKYTDLIQTYTSGNLELFDNKTTPEHFELDMPMTKYTYNNYYISVFTNNSDVIALNYPSEVIFDKNTQKTEFSANFKGVVNATTKWSPRIHNGYYYINQHEYYAYSEFDVDADFEEFDESNFKTATGFLTIDVELRHLAGPVENYNIIKSVRSELIQDETNFTWIDGKGLTILPTINGVYYKEYTVHTYYSPIILFPNKLTSAGKLKLNYFFENGSTYLPLEVRSYDAQNGKWYDWVPFTNDQVPNTPLSAAYQLRCSLSATTANKEKVIDDYLCCYLDWKDDADFSNHTNIVTITDHLKAGPDKADGIFISNVIDYGCDTQISFEIFASNINANCRLYVAAENNHKVNLNLENIVWTQVSGSTTLKARYFRYKIEIPYGEKVYWLHKKVTTKETEVQLPFITGISMTGQFGPEDVYDAFQEVQSFEILTDGKKHLIFPSVYDIISGDINNKGFEPNEIHYVKVKCSNYNINLEYNHTMENENPTVNLLNSPIYATADYETQITTNHSQFILAERDPEKSLDMIHIHRGTPQQYAPITIEDTDAIPYKEVFDVNPYDLKKTEVFKISNEDDRHYIKLSRNDFDIETLEIRLNDDDQTAEDDAETLFNDYEIVNNLVIFKKQPKIGDKITVKYNILYSFYTEIDWENNKTQMTLYTNNQIETARNIEVQNIKPIIEESFYTECKLNLMYSSGMKLIYANKIYDHDNHWHYDSELDAIYYDGNNDGFSMIINDWVPVKNYNMEISAYSSDSDDDVIGFVAAFIKDSSGIPHTLSILVSLNPSMLLETEHNVAVVMDYKTDDEIVIAEHNISFPVDKWNEVPLIKFYVSKSGYNLSYKISNPTNANSWAINSGFSLDTTAFNSKLKVFKNTIYYGFCVRSQQNVYFKDPVFSGKTDKSIGIEEQVKKLRRKYKVFFETNTRNNKFIAEDLSLNPIYRTDTKGFIYITDEHNEPYTINIYRNPKYIRCGGYDKIDVSVECLDYLGNPVIAKDISIDCKYGILNFDNKESVSQKTDMNGVVHFLYESATSPCTDIITARTLNDSNQVVEASVEIINEKITT